MVWNDTNMNNRFHNSSNTIISSSKSHHGVASLTAVADCADEKVEPHGDLFEGIGFCSVGFDAEQVKNRHAKYLIICHSFFIRFNYIE